MEALIKVFDEKEYLNNVLPPLTLKVKRIVYIYHHLIDKHLSNCTEEVLKKYADINVSFLRLENDEEDIAKIFAQYQNFVVDISTNRYLTMLLFEKALNYNQKIVYFDSYENVMKDYRSHTIIDEQIFKLEIEDLIKLSGGSMLKNMHKAPTDEPMLSNTIKKVMNKVLANYPEFISYIQRVNHIASQAKSNGLLFYLHEDKIKRIIDDPMYKILREFKLFEIKGNCLCFKSEEIRDLFEVSGSWLESYLYLNLKESGHYDDVKMSVVIDFSDYRNSEYPITCEIDGVVLKNNHLAFISSKSNKVETDALNEIKTHQERFGNYLSHPIICTLEDLSNKKPSIFLKAQGLKIAVIEYQHFRDQKLVKIMDKILNNSYVYVNRL